MMLRRQWQKPIPPMEFAPELRARLDQTGFTLAEKFAREGIFQSYRPKIAEALARDHLAIAGDKQTYYHVTEPLAAAGTRVANTWDDATRHTRAQHKELGRAHLAKSFDEQAIREHADNYARACQKAKSLEHAEAFAIRCGVEPPDHDDDMGAMGAARARLSDSQWWRRLLRRNWTRRAENVMREIGIVRKGREAYASDDAVMHRHTQKSRAREFLKQHEINNEAGEQLPLFDIAQRSLANPALRRGEFMCRARGFETIAREAGHVAQFWTLTVPSCFHSQLIGGVKNPKFARLEVREGQAWMCKQWARARAKLKRLSILFYGFRIAEPHHDGTVHWHLLMFCRPGDAETIERVINLYWCREHADELGELDEASGRRRNQSARCKLITIDESKGSATGYIAKYVSKNIDGAGTIGEAEDEETGKLVTDSVRRVDAWASVHGVRQFQQIGGPPVGLWRELRRIDGPRPLEKPIERARLEASEKSSFAGMIREVGGIEVGRKTSIRIWKSNHGGVSKYDEVRPGGAIGVMAGALLVRTRQHTWRTVRAGSLAPGETVVGRYQGPYKEGDGAVAKVLNPQCWPGAGKGSKRKGRGSGSRVHARTAAVAALGDGPALAELNTGSSGSSSSSFSSPAQDLLPTWTCSNNCTRASNHAREAPKWEIWVRNWHRVHGRYPTLDETTAVANKGGP